MTLSSSSSAKACKASISTKASKRSQPLTCRSVSTSVGSRACVATASVAAVVVTRASARARALTMCCLVLLGARQVSLQLGCSTTARPSGGIITTASVVTTAGGGIAAAIASVAATASVGGGCAAAVASVTASVATAAVGDTTASCALAVALLSLALLVVLSAWEVAAHIACGQCSALVAARVIVAASTCGTDTPCTAGTIAV